MIKKILSLLFITLFFTEINAQCSFEINAGVQNVLCNGESSGSISIDIAITDSSLFAPPLSYSWSTGDTSNNIDSLSAGYYSLLITDSNNCLKDTSFIVIEPVISLQGSINITNYGTYLGDPYASFSVYPYGGTPPYSYDWFCSGPYICSIDETDTTQTVYFEAYLGYGGGVTISDANGCSIDRHYNMQTECNICVSADIVHIKCQGDSSGSIDLNVGGGFMTTSPYYTYLWENGDTTEDRYNLTAGTYNCTITDIHGEQVITQIVIEDFNSYTFDYFVEKATCGFASNGEILLDACNSNAPYQYSIDSGLTWQSSGLFDSLSFGYYDAMIQDSSGNIIEENIYVGVSNSLGIVVDSIQDISCFSGWSGAIDISINQGTAPYTYLWNTGDTTEDISMLLNGGNYSVLVTDAYGCIDNINFDLSMTSELITNTYIHNTSCFGDSAGFIDLTVSGGTQPYSFLWSNSQTTEDVINLSAGLYSVIVTDANGCISNDTAIINEPSFLSVDATVMDVLCNGGNTGAIDLTVSGGTPPYSYLWSNGDTTQDLNWLLAGTYNLQIADFNNCTLDTSYVITEPIFSPIQAYGYFNTGSYWNDPSQSATVVVTGGTPPYNFNWQSNVIDNSETGQTVPANLYPTCYAYAFVTVTDSNNCNSYNTSFGVYDWCGPPVAHITHVKCQGDSTGEIHLEFPLIGLDPSPPYSVLWSDGDTSRNKTNLAEGVHVCAITNGYNQTQNYSFIIEKIDTYTVDYWVEDVTCNLASNGEILLDACNSNAPYQYSIDSGLTWQSSGLFDSLSFGYYDAMIQDSSGNIIEENIYVGVSNSLGIVVDSIQDISCFSGWSGAIDISINQGTAPYTYLWNTGDTTEDISMLLNGGNYSVLVTDAYGCIDNFDLSMTSELITNTYIHNNPCFGDSAGFIDLTVSGGTQPYSFLWSNSQTTEDVINLSAGLYSVIVTDANGCISNDTAIINEPSFLSVDATVMDVLCNGGNTGAIDLTVSGGTPPYSYLWSNGDTTQDLNWLLAGTYNLQITDFNNCTLDTSFVITEPVFSPMQAYGYFNIGSYWNDPSQSATVVVTGGTPPYNFNWQSNVIDNSETGQTVPANLYPTCYAYAFVTVTDSNNCNSYNTLFSVYDWCGPPVAHITHVKCQGDSTGEIHLEFPLIGLSPSPPYSVLWSDGDTSRNKTNLAEGVHVCAITNGYNQTQNYSFIIEKIDTYTVDYWVEDVTCNLVSNGEILLDACNSNAPYQYSIDSGLTWQSSGLFDSLSFGYYDAMIQDSSGNIIEENIYVGVSNSLGIVVDSIQDISCFSGWSGAIDISINQGTAPYTYLWNTGDTTEDISMLLNGGNYSVLVTDAYGCIDNINFDLSMTSELITNTYIHNNPCFGDSAGFIDLTVSGGTQPYSFLWSNSQTTEDVINLSAGLYSVIVTDANGCSDTINMIVNDINPVYSETNSDTICSGEDYTFADGIVMMNIISDTVYTSSLQSKNGCDSTIETSIVVNPVYSETNSDTICSGEDYTFADGIVMMNIISDTVYTSSLQSKNGCDSTIETSIVVNPVYSETNSDTICSGEDYTFADGIVMMNIISDTVYTSSLQSKNGCDSTIETSIFVNPVYSETNSDTICSGEDYTFADGIVMMNIISDTVYMSSLQSKNGCDSTIETSIFVNPVYSETNSDTICSGEDYTFGDGIVMMNIISDTVYTSSLQSKNGCDSTIETSIVVNPVYSETNSDTICSGEDYTFGDGIVMMNIISDTVYTSSLQSKNGCDSTIETSIVVNPVYSETNSDTICSGEDYTFGDGIVMMNIISDTVYTSSLQSKNGCDSTIETSIFVNPVYSETNSDTICSGEDYTFGDGIVMMNIISDTVYTSSLQSKNGCDSIIETSIFVNPVYSETNSDTICSGEDYTFADGIVMMNIISDTVYTSSLQSKNGCDSTIETSIVVNPVYSETNSDTICSGEDYTFADGIVMMNIISDTVYTSSLQSKNGCDSTIETSIVVNPVYSETNSDTICSGEDYTFADGIVMMNIISDTVYTSSLQSKNGCDSTIETSIFVNPVYSETNSDTICSGEDYTFADGIVMMNIISDTVYMSSLQSKNGCDSTIETSIFVNPVYSETNSDTICSGEDYTFADGIVMMNIISDTVYTSSLQSKNGCDSIIETSIFVNPVYSETNSDTICSGEDYTFGDGIVMMNIISDTVYTSSLQSENGCDSTIETSVYVKEMLTAITQNNLELIADQDNAQYQWINCDEASSEIQNEINQNFIASENGNFAVQIIFDNCIDTSECYNVNDVGIISNSFGQNLLIYPNPTSGNLKIDIGTVYKNIRVNVKTITGKTIETYWFVDSNKFDFDIMGAKGIYFIEIFVENESKALIKVLKK